jgi:hypothetical protein
MNDVLRCLPQIGINSVQLCHNNTSMWVFVNAFKCHMVIGTQMKHQQESVTAARLFGTLQREDDSAKKLPNKHCD